MMRVESLYHYPVKGLSAQRLRTVSLERARGFPFDRIYGIARAESGFDPLHPRPMPKGNFFMLRRDERLAGLETELDPHTRRFTIRIRGRMAHESDLSTAAGLIESAKFFATMFDLPETARPLFASAEPHRFTDVSVTSARMMNAVSVVNVESVADLSRRLGKEVDPLRFRANLYIAGMPPFAEFGLMERELVAGAVRFRVLKRTRRCAATEVNPATARRDLPIPRLLQQHYGHDDMGVYAEVLSDGSIDEADRVSCA